MSLAPARTPAREVADHTRSTPSAVRSATSIRRKRAPASPQLQPGGWASAFGASTPSPGATGASADASAPRICTRRAPRPHRRPRQRIAGIDAHWRGRQRRRRIGARIVGRVGPHGIAVAQRQRRRGMALGDHRARGQRQAQRLRHGFLARLDGPTDRSKLASTSASGVSRAIRWISESATMRGT